MLEIKAWRDTGKPRFRVYWQRFPHLTNYDRWLNKKRSYAWILKIMSYWTLWMAWRCRE